MSHDFYKTCEGDAVFYWYDITSHIQRVFGEDIVEKARVCLGRGYNDDSEDEIERLYSKLECEVKEMERKLSLNMLFQQQLLKMQENRLKAYIHEKSVLNFHLAD